MKELLVKFRITEQVGPDDWYRTSMEKLFDLDTKLSDVRDWIISKEGHRKEANGYKRMVEVKLSEPQ